MRPRTDAEHDEAGSDPRLDASEGVAIHTDGSAYAGNRSGGWAWVAIDAFGSIIEGSGGVWDTTVNRMEMTAAIQGMIDVYEEVGPTDLLIYSDSEYVVLGMRDPGRSRKKNADLWELLEEAQALHDSVVWNHIRGHRGHALNERADELAGAARKALL